MAAATAVRITDASFALAPDPNSHGISGMNAPRLNARKDEPAAAHGDPSERGSIPSSSRACASSAVSGSRIISVGDIARRVGIDAPGHVDVRELDGLRLGVAVELSPLDRELALQQLALRLHRHVLPRGHRERAGDETGNACGANDRSRGAGTRDAEDERHVRHEAVADTEHARSRHAPAHVSVVVLDGRRHLCRRRHPRARHVGHDSTVPP